MREIKFRWRDNVSDSMYYFDIYELSSNRPDKEIYLWPVEQIMQYTWLKDKNWKEIYEGDIIKTIKCSCWKQNCTSFSDEIFEVRFSDSWFYPFSCSDLSNNDRENNNKIIIGNIYENSELLDSNE